MKDVDPIEELHRIRRQICKKAGGTPADYVRYYFEMDKKDLAASKAGEAALPKKTKAAQGKPRRKPAKPAAKTSARNPSQRRKIVSP